MVRRYRLTKPHKDTIKWKIRAQKIYRFYLDFLSKNGRPPTLEEIGETFGVTRQRAGQLVKKMWKEGYLLKADKYHQSYLPNILTLGKKKGRKIITYNLE